MSELVLDALTMSNDHTTIHTSLLFDSDSKTWMSNRSIEICHSTGLITKVFERSPTHSIQENDLDWRGYTVLPGFVDAHTHVLLHSYHETPSLYQERDESMVERILRGTNHAKAALKAGYTTYRDLGTEALGDADIGFRDAINRGIIPGPRLFVATEPLATSKSYEIRYESRLNGTVVPRIADTCDGVDGVMAAVRRRIGAGADIIKMYGDYRRRTLRFPPQKWPGALPIQFPPRKSTFEGVDKGGNSGPSINARDPPSTMWSQAEMNAIVVEAKRAGAPVACHANCPESVIMASKAGVTTIEHCDIPDPEVQKAMKDNGVIFVPTLTVKESEGAPAELMAAANRNVKECFEMGVKIAAGGDTGAFAHGENIREVELLHDAGIPLDDVLQAATLRGWEACGGELSGFKFGWIKKGWSADLVAVDGDPRENIGALRKVVKVIKDARVVVDEGKITQE